jgi:CheY-like chemotaxis protein
MDKNKLIYIVDDDPLISELIVKRLTLEGHHVVAFEYGEDCLKAMDKDPDLIILDYYFTRPDNIVMNGMEVFDKIKGLKPDIYVIMLSGQEKGEIVLELARKGIDDYVIKDNNLLENLNSSIKELLAWEP